MRALTEHIERGRARKKRTWVVQLPEDRVGPYPDHLQFYHMYTSLVLLENIFEVGHQRRARSWRRAVATAPVHLRAGFF
jgi:hypothetical protein